MACLSFVIIILLGSQCVDSMPMKRPDENRRRLTHPTRDLPHKQLRTGIRRNVQSGVHVDLGFAADRHQSIDATAWDQMMTFMSDFIPFVEMEATGSQAGLVSFDEISTLDIRLNAHSTTDALQEDILTQNPGGSGRDISLGIYRLRSSLFTSQNGDSLHLNVGVLITNGVSDYQEAVNEAALFRNTGATLISIGVGNTINITLLEAISGGPGNVLVANNFNELHLLDEQLQQLVSGAANTKFMASPGKIETHVDMAEDFRWTLSETFNTSHAGSYVRVYRGTSVGGVLVIEYASGVGCDTQGDMGVSCIVEGVTVGIHMASVQDPDASMYSAQVKNGVDIVVEDSDAVLYIYKTPTTPVITGNTPVLEGSSMSLTCNANLQSLPAEYRDPASLEYTWSGFVTGSGSTIVIGPLDRSHNGQSLTCEAKEQGASDSLKSSSSVVISVQYAPAYVNMTANSSSVIQGFQGLSMTCAVPADGHGNPTTYTHYWTNQASGVSYSQTSSTLVVGIYDVDKSKHDGTWQCLAGNVVGNSTSSSVAISIQETPTTGFFVKVGEYTGSPTANTVVLFDIVSVNVGNVYNPATGEFTAPMAGLYSMSYAVRPAFSCNSGQDRVCVELNVNEAAVMNYCSTYDSCGGRTVTLQLDVGDRVYVTIRQAAPCQDLDGELFNMFSGNFIA